MAYVGTGGRNIPGSRDVNFPVPVAAPTVNSPDCLQAGQTIPAGGFDFDPCLNKGVVSRAITRPYTGWDAINGYGASYYYGTSNYHSLQGGFQYRAGKGLTLTAAYTYGKVLTDVSDRGFDARQTSNGGQNPRDLKAEYGPPGYDRTHIFTSGYVWNLPLFGSRTDYIGKALGNWTFSGITSLKVALPSRPVCQPAPMAWPRDPIASRGFPDLKPSNNGSTPEPSLLPPSASSGIVGPVSSEGLERTHGTGHYTRLSPWARG